MSIESESTRAQAETVETMEPIDHRKTPRCFYHPNVEAEVVCDRCELNICGKDMKVSGTIEVCTRCHKEFANDATFGVPYAYTLGILPIFIVVLVYILI